MNDTVPRITTFLHAARQQLDRRLAAQVAAWGLLAGGGVALVGALPWVLAGYRVPPVWYALCAALMLAAGALAWFLRRPDLGTTARTADRTFALRDALHSFLTFQADGRQDGLYALQAARTAEALPACVLPRLGTRVPARRWWLGAACCVAAVALGFLDESAAVRGERQRAADTLERTTAIAAVLDELMQRAEAELAVHDPGSAEALRELAERVAATSDPAEAMRRYAEIERELRERIARLTPREELDLLDRAAEDLKQTPETRELGEQLAKRDYPKAAEELERQAEAVRKQTGQEQRDQLARLKAAAQRMAQAARSQAQSRQGAGGREGGSARSARASSGAAGAAGEASAGELDDLLADLETAALDAERELDEAQRQFDRLQRIDPDQLERCESACRSLGQCSGALGERLRRIDARNRASAALARLRQQLGQCQSCLAGEQPAASLALLLMQSNGLQGGQQAGAETEGGASEPFAGVHDRLTGQKGAGPSQVTVEASDHGDATSRQRVVARQRTFDQQVEAFVARDDVPEDLKHAVKTYFTTIHETGTAP